MAGVRPDRSPTMGGVTLMAKAVAVEDLWRFRTGQGHDLSLDVRRLNATPVRQYVFVRSQGSDTRPQPPRVAVIGPAGPWTTLARLSWIELMPGEAAEIAVAVPEP